MEYLVLEIKADPLSPGSEAKAFTSIADAVKHIQKNSNANKLFLSDKDKNIDQLEWILMDRLATVTLTTGDNDENQWMITAF